ncbi:MAG: hypothetical protein R2857_06440 [Vampirovibrionales bacterium]
MIFSPAFLAKKYQEEDHVESGDALMTETELYLPDKSTIQIFVAKRLSAMTP